MSTLGNKMAQQWDNRYTIHCKEIGPKNHEYYMKQWNGSLQIFNNYWMRFIVMFRIIKVEVGVISWGQYSPSRVLMLACRNSGDLGSSWNYTITCNLHLFCGANVGSLGHLKCWLWDCFPLIYKGKHFHLFFWLQFTHLILWLLVQRWIPFVEYEEEFQQCAAAQILEIETLHTFCILKHINLYSDK